MKIMLFKELKTTHKKSNGQDEGSGEGSDKTGECRARKPIDGRYDKVIVYNIFKFRYNFINKL